MSEEEVMEDSGPSEAERAMQRRREAPSSSGLDEYAQELLEANKVERDAMEDEIRELRQRSERRKKEREEEERRMAQQRQEEEQRRKAEEEERRRKKDEEEESRRSARAAKMAEFEKWKNPPTPNFVITKKSGGGGGGDEDGEERKDDRKSKEQLEAEKKAILAQRVQKLEIDGFDEAKLQEKAKEIWNLIFRLEGEKYDLEKRFKEQQYDMMELAERARQMNKVGKGGLRRIQPGSDEVDQIQERFAGAPARIQMFSEFDRQKDKRTYSDRQQVFTGPHILYPAERIKPYRILKWNEAGLPCYEDIPGAQRPDDGEGEEEE